MLDITKIFERKAYFVFVFAMSVLLNLTLHFILDNLHMPIFLDKVGILLMAYSFGPVSAVIVGVVTSLILTLTDPFYVFRTVTWIAIGLVWGFGFSYAKRKRSDIILIVIALLGSIIVYLSDLTVFITTMYFPFKEDVLPYTRWFNLFTAQAVDALISFIFGLIILRAAGITKFTEEKDLELKFKAVFIIILMILTPILMYVSYVNETALVPYLPKKEGWVFVNVRMDFVWAPMGVKGSNNYYYPEGRFNRSDPGYQVWFGLYWVQGRFGIYDDTYVQEEIFAFSILDQDTWLSLHGHKTPVTKVHNITGVAWGTFKGYRALFMNGSYESQSDVPPYEDVILVGFFIVFYMPKYDRTVIIYACAVDRYYHIMEPILWEMAKSIELPP